MTDLTQSNVSTEITAQDHILNAYQFLKFKDFLAKFETAKGGGIHDFMEITLFNMISADIKSIDDYLKKGHTTINANEIMLIIVDTSQKVLDSMQR